MSVFKKERLPPPEASPRPAHSVLIVDDEAGNLSVLRALLSPRYRVLEAADGEQALALLDRLPREDLPCVVLSDQSMPGMSGIELCSRLRERLPAAIRIIVTGFVDVGAVVDSINRAGIYSFVVKPYDRDELLVTVERAIEAYEMRRRIERQVDELELRVRERTAELEQANRALREAYAEIEKASLTDPLTGLGNRRRLLQAIEAELQPVEDDRRRDSALRHVVVLADLDHFKQINDQYGHPAGDQLLVRFADLLRSHCRAGDLAVRWGGEEFLMYFGVRDEVQAISRAEALRAAVAATEFDLGGVVVRRSCSIGLACLPFDVRRPDWVGWQQVVDLADHALYLAKRGGRNQVVALAADTEWADAAPAWGRGIDALLASGYLLARRPEP